jgi:hypothetical protein
LDSFAEYTPPDRFLAEIREKYRAEERDRKETVPIK